VAVLKHGPNRLECLFLAGLSGDMTLRITTLSIKSYNVTLSINNMWCHCAEYRVLFTIMLNVVRLSVVMLSVVAPACLV
jgi:hypothetical protein